MTDTETAQYIKDTYEDLAAAGQSGLCCSPLGLYSPEQIAQLPDDVLKLSSGCGHPVDDAHLSAGMTVVDVGSGAGADCMLAARRVGATGRVIGVDPSVSMRATAQRHRDAAGLAWVDYRAGTADDLPVDDSAADVVISNCVLSLAVEPDAAWGEVARVLRVGGHAVVSDIVGGQPANDPLLAQAKCETGISWQRYRQVLFDAGFAGIKVLHVRAAAFRDGASALSVTFDTRRGTSGSHRAIDVLHDDDQASADRYIAALTDQNQAKPFTVSVRRLDQRDPANRSLIELMNPTGAQLGPLAIAVDGLVDAAALTALV